MTIRSLLAHSDKDVRRAAEEILQKLLKEHEEKMFTPRAESSIGDNRTN
jgi:uncharacterized protein (UPF0147 family)